MREIRRVEPVCAPWRDSFTYDSLRVFGSDCLLTPRGVQQEDPLASSSPTFCIHDAVLDRLAATDSAHGDELQLQSLDFDNIAEDSTGSVVLSFVDSLRRVSLKGGTGRKCEPVLTVPVLHAPDPYNIFELKMETIRRFRAAGSFL